MSLIKKRILFSGSALLVLLLCFVFIAITGIRSLEKNISNLTEQTIPILSETHQALLHFFQASNSINSYRQALNEKKLKIIKAEYQESIETSLLSIKNLLSLIKENSKLYSHLQLSQQSINDFYTVAETIFAKHKQSLIGEKKLQRIKKEYKNTAEQLDTFLYEISEYSNENIDGLKTMSNMIYEINTTISNAFALETTDGINKSMKNLVSMVKSLEQNFEKIKQNLSAENNQPFTHIEKTLNDFKGFTIENGSVLNLLKADIELKNSTLQLLIHSSRLELKAKENLNIILEKNQLSSSLSQSKTNVYIIALIIITLLIVLILGLLINSALKSSKQ